MGEAKQVECSGKVDIAMATYREANFVTGVMTGELGAVERMASVMDLMFGDVFPSLFNTDCALVEPDRDLAVQSIMEEAAAMESGHLALVDVASLKIAYTVDRSEFEKAYVRMCGSECTWATRGGRETRGAVIDGKFIGNDGERVEDLTAFLRGKVRLADGIEVRADEAACLQFSRIMRAVEEGLVELPMTQLLHVIMIAKQEAFRPKSRGEAADGLFLVALSDPQDVVRRDMPPCKIMSIMFANVLDMAWSLPQGRGFYSYAAATGDKPSLFRLREEDDDQSVWEGYAVAAERAGGQRIGPGACRASLELDLDALKSASGLSRNVNPVAFRRKAVEVIAAAERFFAEAKLLHRETVKGVLVEVFDRDEVRFMTLTTPTRLTEIVGWPLAEPRRRPDLPAAYGYK